MYAKEGAMFSLSWNGWSSSCCWTKDGWQTFCFPLSLSCQKEEVFKLTPVILREFANVTRKPGDRKKFCILVTGHDHLRYFYKEKLEIVAKAVAGLKDGSYEIISVGAAN